MKAKRIVSLLLCLVMILATCGCGGSNTKSNHLRLQRNDWSDDVKTAINDLLAAHGADSDNYAEDTYAVFDFDNTSSIFDIEEQLCIYQIETMTFAIEPKDLPTVLLTDLSDKDADLSEYELIKGSYQNIIDDITNAYSYLWENYGPFTPKGLDESKQAEIQKEDQWKEFGTKLRLLYELVYDVESSSVAYPWVLYWFTGMTEQEVYDLAYKSHSKYSKLTTSEVTWTSPESIKSNIGSVSYTWTSGFGVTENIKELWKTLQDNGIDVWVCSASCTGAVRAAIDVLGLHDYCTGMLGMTTKKDANGKYVTSYDYETGCGFYADEDGKWTQMTRPIKAQTFGEGKVQSISNAIAPEYKNHGPIAGFMDSTGDFNFCTEFKTLKLVCCFNRASRKVTDGGGLVAEMAMYEKNILKYDFETAEKNEDTLYVLQGRDENGMRSFRNSNSTLRYGSTEEKLFANEDNVAQLEYIINNNMTVADAFKTFAINTPAEKSPLKIKTGFFESYAGYHTVD